MSFKYEDFEDDDVGQWSPVASKSADTDYDEDDDVQTATHASAADGIADDATEESHADKIADDTDDKEQIETENSVADSLIEDAATRAIMTQMHMVRLAEPAVRVGLRALPDSKYKTLALEVFNKWTELEKENSRVSPPNMLHFAYMSLIMARCIVLILEKIVETGLGTTARMAINVVANRLQAALV